MTRTMTRNHAHFRRAIKRLPLGVASNFRYWGEDRTIYVRYGRGARIVDGGAHSRHHIGETRQVERAARELAHDAVQEF